MIFLLQWWCRDLGSLPTFVAIYACGFLLRICYPKAKFSKNKLIAAGAVLLVVAVIGIKFAPSYVQDRKKYPVDERTPYIKKLEFKRRKRNTT